MPTYKNNLDTDNALGSNRLSPGETIELVEIFPTLPTGITKESDVPTWNPVLFSERFTGGVDATEEVVVPPATNMKMVINCVAGAVEVRFNVASMEPPVLLSAGQVWQKEILTRFVDKILLKFKKASSEATVVLEK